MESESHTSAPYQVFILTLSLFAIALLGVQATSDVSEETATILGYADVLLCLLFLLDFIHCLWTSENRLRYLRTWGWLDLLSCIPTLDLARWGRLARILRIARIFRGIRATKILSQLILEHKSESSMLAATLVALLMVVFSSIAILNFEKHPNSNITSAEDAVWWACTTMTTVGYGDKYPVTSEGRLIAVLLMVVGVGMFGTFSGFVAAWFLAPTKSSDRNSTLQKLEADLQKLTELLRERLN